MEDKKLRVCKRCLMAIESREGYLATVPVYFDEDEESPFICDWCETDLYDTLYEIQ